MSDAKIHSLSDCYPAIALIRDANQRRETFFQLAEKYADECDYDGSRVEIAEPEWQWYRINPCTPNCGEHSWHYADGKEGRPGSFRGALVVIKPKQVAS